MFKTKYRMTLDWFSSRYWMVQKKVWFWPFWLEVGNGVMTKEQAKDAIETLKEQEYKK